MSNTGVLAGGRIVNAVFSFVYIAWTVRALGLETFGVMLLITTFASLVSDLTHLHSWQTLLHYGARYLRRGRPGTFSSVLAFCIRSDMLSASAGAVTGIAGVLLFSSLMGWPPSARPAAMLCMLTILFMNTGWAVGVLQIGRRFKWLMLFQAFSSCVRTAGCGIGYFFHFGLGYFLAVWSSAQITLFLLSVTAAFALVRGDLGAVFPWREIVRPVRQFPGIRSFTLSVSATEILDELFQQGGMLVIGGVLSARDAAVFRVTRQISSAISRLAAMMTPTVYPEFAALRDAGDWRSFRSLLRRLLALIAGVSLAALVLAETIGEPVLSYMLHAHWPGGRTLLVLLLVSSLLDVGLIPVRPVLTLMGRVSLLLRVRTVVICFYFAALWPALRLFGVKGAALCSVIASGVMFVTCLVPVLSWVSGRVRATSDQSGRSR